MTTSDGRHVFRAPLTADHARDRLIREAPNTNQTDRTLMYFRGLFAAIALMPTIVTSQAAPSAQSPARTGPTLGFALDLGVEFGGDDFLEVFFTNGGSQKLRAGQGGTLAVGGILRPNEGSPLSLRGTVGFKFVTTAADNANIMFTRIPVELVGSYAFPNAMRVGLGVVHHANNRFKGDGYVDDATFEPATGFTAEIGYKALAVTYTALEYRVRGGQPFNGGSIGAQLLWTPQRKRR